MKSKIIIIFSYIEKQLTFKMRRNQNLLVDSFSKYNSLFHKETNFPVEKIEIRNCLR